MIIVSVISLLFSLLIQGLMSNFFEYTIDNLSIFSAVYVLINLVVLMPYFEDNKNYCNNVELTIIDDDNDIVATIIGKCGN